MITLDGVIQAPGGSKEDQSKGSNMAAGSHPTAMKITTRW